MKKVILLAAALGTGILFQGFSADNKQGDTRISNAFNYPVTDRDFIMQHLQAKLDYAKFIVFDLNNIAQLKDLTPSEKNKLATVYIIIAKTGEIVSAPTEVTETTVYNRSKSTKEDFNEVAEVTKTPPNGKDIADKTIQSWEADETRIVYDIGGYFTTVAVTKDRELVIIAIPDIYQK